MEKLERGGINPDSGGAGLRYQVGKLEEGDGWMDESCSEDICAGGEGQCSNIMVTSCGV